MMTPLDRLVIVGTAATWRDAPWKDVDFPLWALNDSYLIDGFERADEFFDLHPLDHFHLLPMPEPGKKVAIYAHQIPLGKYVRPAQHLDWLATQTIPIWLHPDHAQQLPASATWPMARPFPKAEVEAHFGRYFTSTPAWMLALAILRGAREVHIYGIHLSTEAEYIDQRPNFEFLLGCLLGRTKRTITVADGLRRYESQDGCLVLPVSSPVLSASFQYAFEPSPRRQLDPLKWDLHKAQVKRERTVLALKTAARWKPWTTVQEPQDDGTIKVRRVSISTLQQELYQYDALVADCQDQLARVSVGL
jgi:hypothetical protein